jgi:DNA sulfur modification protein DndD
MRINKLILKNIGAYYGNYEFDFTTNGNRNIILFGGKNGSGKTTLLESLRISLFGPLAYGYMSENEPYKNKIKTLLSKTALQMGVNSFHITIHLSQVENFERSNYTLTRRWKLYNGNLKETLDVIREKTHLSKSEVENFQNKLRDEIPPQLFELCLFDGEEISKIISEDRLSYYLQQSGKVLFNLDLFESLERDLSSYINIEAQKNNTEHEESQLNEYELQISASQNQKKEILYQIDHKTFLLNEEKEKLTNLKKDFTVHGGLLKEQRQTLLNQINEIEHKRKLNNDSIKKYISSLLPFYLTKSLLNATIEQMENEKENEVYDYVSKKISPEQMSKVIDELNTPGLINDENTRQALHNSFKNLFQPEDQLTIHRASFIQKSEVQELSNQLNKVENTNYLKLIDENNKFLIKASSIRKKVEKNDSASDFKILLRDIEKTTQQIEQLKLKIVHLEENLADVSDILTKQIGDREKILTKLNSSKKSNNSLVISSNIIKVSERFREIQLIKKLKQVEIEAAKMANQLFQKKQLISAIKINHHSFNLSLFDSHKQEIIKERLSAGEKELLMLSIIWAMFKCSGKKLPFVFDTLLGRLDKDHKIQLILNFLPICGEQVIVLSTDSEISNAEFKKMKDNISKIYTLEYISTESRIKVISGKYFDIKN